VVRITKYPQSCFSVETDHARLLIDPGSYAADAIDLDELGRFDLVVYTHRHGDHFDQRLVEPLAAGGATFVTNADVAPLLGEHTVAVLGHGQRADIAGVSLQAFDLEHCPMVDGSAGPPNTGFLIEDLLFHPGDGTRVPRSVSTLLTPIAGPSISFRDAYLMVEEAGASRVIPMHYDAFKGDPEQFQRACGIATVTVLQTGESTVV